jgi:hypothetical protein
MRTINNLLGVVSIILLLSCEGTTGDGNNTNGDIINPEGAPVLTCADFNDDITLEDEPGREVDYIIDCLVDVDDIEIEIIDGAVIEFTQGSGFIFREGSRVNFFALPGTVPPVILRGNRSEPGYWKGIHVASDQGSNLIRGVEIHDAGSKTDPMFYGAVTISGGVQLGSTLINNSDNYGVYYEDEIGVWQTFAQVEITNCKSYPVRIGFQQVGELSGYGINSYSNNNPNRIQVISEPLTKSTTFRNQGIPFEISESLIAAEIVTVEDDVELIFKKDTRLIIQLQLSAWDDGGDPIIFRSHDGVPGGWQGIYFETEQNTTGTGNRLDNVVIKDGGDDADMSANIAIESGKVNIQNCQISNSKSCGLKYIVPQTKLNEQNNLYFENPEGSICKIF